MIEPRIRLRKAIITGRLMNKEPTMTNETRSEILKLIRELSEHCPDVRFGQLVTNIAYLAKGAAKESVWNVEDEEFLEAAKKHLKEFQTQQEVV